MTFTATTIRKLRALNLDEPVFDAVMAIFEEAKEAKPKKKGCAADRAERATRLPADWALPDEWRAWALAVGLYAGEVNREAMKFKNYWLNVVGPRGSKLSWSLTWQNWCLSTMERAGRQPNPPPGAPPAAAATGPETFTESTWQAIAKRVKGGAQWNPLWGPGPDRIDCRMPPGLL